MSKIVTGITLAGEDRALFYRWRDAVDLETRLGGESTEAALRERGFKRLVVFLWAGLKHSNDRLKEDDVIKMMDRSDMDYGRLWERVSTALVESGLLPKPEGGPVPTSGSSPGATEG